MDRRSSIKTLLIFSAGAALLPSCMEEEKRSSLSLKNIKINGKDEELLAELSETIIPKTDTPGAKDISTHLFALMMVDDCYTKENQDKFAKGLKEFEDFTKKKFDKSFVKCTPSERSEILKSIESKKDIPENVASFYNNIKRLTVQAFTTSEYYLTKVQVYKLVPGKFYGCVPVKKAS
ncbi:MAG: gluconate 2-dehydrogenase subunit 3 family protein [Ginsengibacter sp.]